MSVRPTTDTRQFEGVALSAPFVVRYWNFCLKFVEKFQFLYTRYEP